MQSIVLNEEGELVCMTTHQKHSQAEGERERETDYSSTISKSYDSSWSMERIVLNEEGEPVCLTLRRKTHSLAERKKERKKLEERDTASGHCRAKEFTVVGGG